MANAERVPIRGSGGFAPSGVQGRSPWWRSGGQSSPEADDIFALLDYICEVILTLVARFCCIRERTKNWKLKQYCLTQKPATVKQLHSSIFGCDHPQVPLVTVYSTSLVLGMKCLGVAGNS